MTVKKGKGRLLIQEEQKSDKYEVLNIHVQLTLIKEMRRFRLGSRVMRMSGVALARTYVYDWMILMLLLVILLLLQFVEPFPRFVGKDTIRDFKYPLEGDTVPFWAVPMYSVLLPMLVVVGVYIRRRDIYDLHHAMLGLLYSILVTAVITDAVKAAVGRPRPDFFWRCFPDGKDVYDRLGNIICHQDKDIIGEGHRSFPSGHTSWSFAGLGFLSLYLAGKIKAFDRKGHDVFASCLLGFMVATFCYLQFFPPPNHSEGWGPYSYFRELEESGDVNMENATTNGQCSGVQCKSRGEEQRCNGSIGLAMVPVSDRSLEAMESGGA
ncbi:hypothetical protein MLD38_022807 [Melastoma candidum]|uniref:Uncharacterized protein n=1 Tax=Melastoma candidum TaxID=119954 RepID=A0ACB9QKN3_9MYRT|nr:hypothetical protein MLD38_022807 [Melastoma candidum]